MEMPTPCDCGETVELNDMNPCEKCEKLYCKGCLSQPWETCDNCK